MNANQIVDADPVSESELSAASLKPSVGTGYKKQLRGAPSVTRTQVALFLAIGFLIVLTVAAVLPGVLTSHNPVETDLLAINQKPSLVHLAGTDHLGRDVFSRIVYGARYSLSIGVFATLISVVFGILLGAISGAGGRALDTIFSRFVDALASFPSLLLVMLIIGIIGQNLTVMIVALGLSGVPGYARVIRSQTALVIRSGYVQQARTFGLGRVLMTWRHVIPNAVGVVPVLATMNLGAAILAAASLSFVGLGPQAPIPEWGAVLAESRSYLGQAWWVGVFPGVVLTLCVISISVIGRAWHMRYERRDQ